MIHFIIDKRTHKGDRVFNERSHHIQGPSLTVFNDKSFEKKDYEGLQNLGIGSKGNSVDTIGKFGIGFNTVYSITDTPMFISNNSLVFLDPHREFVECATSDKPGGKFELKPDFVSSYSDILSGFKGLGDIDLSSGTTFRLPLRDGSFNSKIESEKRNISDNSKM